MDVLYERGSARRTQPSSCVLLTKRCTSSCSKRIGFGHNHVGAYLVPEKRSETSGWTMEDGFEQSCLGLNYLRAPVKDGEIDTTHSTGLHRRPGNAFTFLSKTSLTVSIPSATELEGNY